VLLCLGGNDGLRQLPLNEMEKNLNQLITIFKKHGAKVMLIGVQLPTNYNSKYRTDFEAIFPKLAKKNQIHFHPFLLGSIFGNKDLFLTDMIHPNADGQKKVASKLLEKLEKLL
jgi:acyl-CoA thioesterase-1